MYLYVCSHTLEDLEDLAEDAVFHHIHNHTASIRIHSHSHPPMHLIIPVHRLVGEPGAVE